MDALAISVIVIIVLLTIILALDSYERYFTSKWNLGIYYVLQKRVGHWVEIQINRKLSIESSKNFMLILLGIAFTWEYNAMIQAEWAKGLIFFALIIGIFVVLETLERLRKKGRNGYSKSIAATE